LVWAYGAEGAVPVCISYPPMLLRLSHATADCGSGMPLATADACYGSALATADACSDRISTAAPFRYALAVASCSLNTTDDRLPIARRKQHRLPPRCPTPDSCLCPPSAWKVLSQYLRLPCHHFRNVAFCTARLWSRWRGMRMCVRATDGNRRSDRLPTDTSLVVGCAGRSAHSATSGPSHIEGCSIAGQRI